MSNRVRPRRRPDSNQRVSEKAGTVQYLTWELAMYPQLSEPASGRGWCGLEVFGGTKVMASTLHPQMYPHCWGYVKKLRGMS